MENNINDTIEYPADVNFSEFNSLDFDVLINSPEVIVNESSSNINSEKSISFEIARTPHSSPFYLNDEYLNHANEENTGQILFKLYNFFF